MQDGGRIVRFELDPRARREATALRVAAALLVTMAGAWLIALPHALPRAFAVAGFVFAALWIARAVRERRLERAGAFANGYLELTPDRLRLGAGARTVEVAWSEVEAVTVDEDRLLLRVARHGAPALEIEPQYRGASLYELRDAVQAAHASAVGAPQPPVCAPPRNG